MARSVLLARVASLSALFYRLFRFPLLDSQNTIPEPDNQRAVILISFQVYPILQYGVPQASQAYVKSHAHNYGAGYRLYFIRHGAQ